MTEDQRKQWRTALANKAKQQRTHRGRQTNAYRDTQVGVRWMPRPTPEPTRLRRRGV
jgi:hypothetical protein